MIVEHGFEGLSQNFIFPTGPQPCDLLLIGEAGGENEDQEHRCFVGKTGRELDKFYLPLANLRRHEVRVTNLVPFHPFGNRTPVHAEVKFCEQYLLKEIEETKPKILAPMGLTATQYFLGFVDLHTVHGIPHRSKRFPDQIILPTYHPALGLHQADAQPLIVYDFQQLQLAMTGNLPERAVDTFDKPAYVELMTRADVFQSLEGCDRVLMGQDTEGYRYNPWGLSYSIDEGVAYVIRIQYKEALAAFDEWLQAHPEVTVILHNALHDLPILREMGVRVPTFEDTMVYSYCLCLEPQGLKDLAYRHCGMKMRSYDDVTGPAMRKLTGEYLIKVAQGDWGLDPEVPERDSDQVIKYRQPTALHKRALRAVNDVFGLWTGTIVGPKRGGSAKLDELGVRVDKVDHDTVKDLGLIKEIKKTVKKKSGLIVEQIKYEQVLNAWHCEVPIPFKDTLEQHYGDFIFDLKPPVQPEDPPDPVKRWGAMCDDLEESVARCEDALGTLPQTGLDAIEDQQVAIDYSARDAHATLAIRTKLREKVEANGMIELADLDMSVLPYIDAMKTAGIKVNRDHMLAYGEQLKIEMRQIQEKLHENLGIWINPSSSQQVAMVIYDMLGFPVEVRTETGLPSTNDKILEALAPFDPNITLITDFRELHKLRGTYALKLPRWTDEFHRVHPNWKTTRVPSGRLACSDPNLMAIPIRSERGNEIRRGFVPEPGFVFIGVDLSQIEMRVLAHLSKDPNLIKLFNEGRDFHTATAAFMWKLPFEAIEKDHKAKGGSSMRSSGKNVSFGIVYGVTAKGLQAQVKSKTHQEWSEEQCQSMIDMWLGEAYPYVRYYMERQKHMARRDGFVRTLTGRRRYLPGVHSTIPRIREEAHRQAINHPVQGTAAEVIKLAMRNLWYDALPMLRESGIRVRPVLQIHDELVFEVEEGAAEEVAAIVVDAMQRAMVLCVPVTADYHVTKTISDGGSWADLK